MGRKARTGKNRIEVPEEMKLRKRRMVVFVGYMVRVLMMTVFAARSFATNNPIAVANNLSSFIVSLIRAIGLILLGLSIMQVGLPL